MKRFVSLLLVMLLAIGIVGVCSAETEGSVGYFLFGMLMGVAVADEADINLPAATTIFYQDLVASVAVNVLDVRITYVHLSVYNRWGKSLGQIFLESLTQSSTYDERVAEVGRKNIDFEYIDQNIVVLQIIKSGDIGEEELEFFYVYLDDLPYGWDQ